MDSRVRENPERTFELVLQVACPTTENEDPTVLWKFPQDFGDQEVLQTVPKFCFPFDVESVSQNQVGQNFTFVLTDIQSKQRFGFCRLTSGCKVCICLLSFLPWFEIYYKLLNTLADYLTKHQEADLNDLLEKLYRLTVPNPNTAVTLSLHVHFVAPDITRLPTIPENRNLTEYFVAVDVNNMLHLYAHMLHERRIIVTSSKLSTLAACVHGSASMLYPMHWQHIYIPVLPPQLLDYCCAPMPYLIGVHLSLLERVKSRSLEDVTILNVDTNTLESPADDLRNLPTDVVSNLKCKLKKQSTATGSGVARAFLRSQAALFGSYRDALRYKPGEPITFCEASFVAHRSSAMRSFLEMAVNLQLFKQFIDGRLAKLNEGKGFTDVFEEEITEGDFCRTGNSRSYQQWMRTVKRGVNKASPAVKSAYKIAKVHAIKGLRGVKGRIRFKEEEEEEEEEEEDGLYCRSSSSSTKSLSPRRLQKRRNPHQDSQKYISLPGYFVDQEDELDTARKIFSEESGEVLYIEESDSEFLHDAGQTGQMNLLEEILDSLSNTTFDHETKLSSAKSLDFFWSMDKIDCYTTNLSSAETCPVQTGGVDMTASGDHHSWNKGQDDSGINGKHLPPSLWRQCSTCSLPASSIKPRKTLAEMRNSLIVPFTQPLALEMDRSASPFESPELPSDLRLNSERQMTEGCSGLRRKALSKETLRPYQDQQDVGHNEPALLIPWKVNNKDNREYIVQEKGSLEEIECHLSAALNSNL